MAFLSKKLLLQSQYRFAGVLNTNTGVYTAYLPTGVYLIECMGGGGQGGFNDETGEVLGGAGGHGDITRTQIVVSKPTTLTYYVGAGGAKTLASNGGAGGAAGVAGYAYAGGAGGAGGLPSWMYFPGARQIRLATFTNPSVTVYAPPSYRPAVDSNVLVYYSDPAYDGSATRVIAKYQADGSLKLPDGSFVYRDFNKDILMAISAIPSVINIFAFGGGGGGGAGGQGRYVNGGAVGSGGGGGGGFYDMNLNNHTAPSFPGKPGAQGNGGAAHAGTDGNTTYFPDIYSGAGTNGYYGGSGAAASGGGASGGGGGIGKLSDSDGYKRRGGGGGGGAGGSYSAGGGGGGKGIWDVAGNNAYNYYTTPIATWNGYGQGGAGGGGIGNDGYVSISKIA